MPPLLLPPHLPLSLSRPRLTALLRTLPLPPSLLSASTPPLTLARTLFSLPIAAATQAAADTLDLLTLLSTPAGGAAITDASRAAALSLPLRLPAADLAAVLLTRRAADPRYEAVLERALLAFARIVPRTLALELLAKEPRKAAAPGDFLGAVESLLGPRFGDAWHVEDDEHGSLHVAVLRRGRSAAAFSLRDRASTRRARRDHVADVIRIDVTEGRIVLQCDDPALEVAYAKAAGASLFGDASFFLTERPAYTLKAMVLLGSKGLAALRLPGISRVRVVDITWDDGEGITHNAHGSDALAAFEKRGGAGGGYVTGAMFRIDATDVARPIDVVVRLPDRASYRPARHERLARAALAAIGAQAAGRIADDSWSLAPWIHAEWRWRRVLLDALFGRMQGDGALVPAKTRMVGAPSMGKYGWSYVAFDLKSAPGRKYAVAMDTALPSRDVEEDELRMWRLDPAAVARALAKDLATEPAVPDAAIGAAALDLGIVRGEGLDLRVVAVLRDPGPAAPALVEAMVRAAGTAHLVVLLPEGRTLGAGVEVGLTIAELFGQARIAAKVFGRVAAKKGLPRVVAPWRLAAPETRFVAEEKTGRMWLDRHELTLREIPARILLGTARGGGQPVPTSTLVKFVAPNRSDDGVVRQTVPRLGDWIRECFAASGLEAPEDAGEIVEFVVKKGWRMTVKCEVY